MTPQPPIDTPNKPTIGHAEYKSPELRTIGYVDVSPVIKPDKWISVNESLPPLSGGDWGASKRVLIVVNGNVETGTLTALAWWSDFSPCAVTVTHWRELPQPPSA